jgi:hypothetical protein
MLINNPDYAEEFITLEKLQELNPMRKVSPT